MPKRSTPWDHWSYQRAAELMRIAARTRQVLGLTQKDLNEGMQYSQSGISQLENGIHPGFSLALYLRYWRAMGFDLVLTPVRVEEDE
jgi:transcriptional regulator with XRE-family HTH domain